MCPEARPNQGGWLGQAHLRNCLLGKGPCSARQAPRMREWSWESPKGAKDPLHSVPPHLSPRVRRPRAFLRPNTQHPATPQRRVNAPGQQGTHSSTPHNPQCTTLGHTQLHSTRQDTVLQPQMPPHDFPFMTAKQMSWCERKPMP